MPEEPLPALALELATLDADEEDDEVPTAADAELLVAALKDEPAVTELLAEADA